MSLNIKNQVTHERVRRLAALTGLSQTAAVDEAVERRLAELEAGTGRRAARIDLIVKEIQVEFTPDQRNALRTAEDDLYDRNGLPR